MTKKIAASLLAVMLLTASMTGFALAAAPDTEADIEFIETHVSPHIPDLFPRDPALAGFGVTGIQSLDALDFHTHTISVTTQTYDSWVTGEPTLQSAIGLPIYSSQNFTVQLQLGEFTIGTELTNEGSRLTLRQGGPQMTAPQGGTQLNGVHGWQSWNDATNPARVELFSGSATATVTAGSGASINVAQGENFIAGVPLQWATNLVGSLEVLAGTARVGVAQAEMIWSVIPQGN